MVYPAFVILDMGPPAQKKEIMEGLDDIHHELVREMHHPSKPFNYTTCSIFEDPEDIETMIRLSEEVRYEVMMRKCHLGPFMDIFGYERSSRHGRTLRKDPDASFHSSFFAGARCFYITFRGARWIWL